MLILQIDGKIHLIDKAYLNLFADCITGFRIIQTQYDLEVQVRFPCGVQGVLHFPKNGVQLEEWLQSGFEHCNIERGVHKINA